jgi:hypothetical protein
MEIETTTKKQKTETFPFDTKEGKTPQKYCRKPKEIRGMHIVKLCYVRVADIIRGGLNKARVTGAKERKIKKIMKCIDAGQYRPSHYIPPVITLAGILVSGEHRLCGHEGCDEEWIWVAICEFDSDTRAIAYAYVENSEKEEEDFGTELADDDDLVFNVKMAIDSDDSEVNANQTSIRNYIKELGYEGNLTDAVKRVMQEIDKTWVPIHAVTHKNIEKMYEDEYGIDPNTDDSIWVGSLTGTQHISEYPRMTRGILPTLLEGKDATVAVKFTGTRSDQFKPNRKRIAEKLRPHILQTARDIVEAEDSDTGFGKINFRYVKQLPSDPTFIEINADEN